MWAETISRAEPARRFSQAERTETGIAEKGWRMQQAGQDETSNELEELDPSLLTEEERAMRAAHERADAKVALARETARAGLITLPLLVLFPFGGVIALLFFGVKLGKRAFRVLYEPELRDRFLREEVQRRVHTDVHSERASLEGEHHRTLEQLSASIAHEIRNPITAAKSLIQQMREDPESEDRAEYARVAVSELERVERSISHLLRFGREEDTRLSAVAMEDVLESAIETFRDRAARSQIEITRQYDSPGRLEGDPEQLRRVVINLISNGMDAIEASGPAQPAIQVSMGENLAGSEVWIRIEDNGAGMEESVQDQIFDPFFTSREGGTGLGLALCRKMVDDHRGRIEVESKAGQGTTFLVTLPKRSEDSAVRS